MLSVTVHKDIGEYTEKVVGKMSVRTLVCTAGGLAASVGAAALSYFGLGIDVADATLPVMACSMPFWMAGFWRPKGLVAEKFAPLYFEHLMGSGRLVYASGNGICALAESLAEKKLDRRARRRCRKKGVERNEPSREGL